MEKQRPQVGVAVIVVKNNKVLLLRRTNSHGEGTWNFPGGHLEFNESLEDCSKRETLEESDITIKNIKFASLTNDVFKEKKKHYITIFMISDWKSGEAKIMEPNKATNIGWFEWDNLPQPLFLTEESLLKQGYNPFK
ncbi:MAG: NUDIX hydrolase [Candidatus Aenigmatarchaeota archaeon]